jgi:hypothetical protein
VKPRAPGAVPYTPTALPLAPSATPQGPSTTPYTSTAKPHRLATTLHAPIATLHVRGASCARVVRSFVCGCVVGSALLFVTGCTGGAPKPARQAELVAPADLPERQRQAWERWQKGGAEWELEREAVREDPALARFTVDNLVVLLVRSYERSELARAGERAGPFERAQAELV